MLIITICTPLKKSNLKSPAYPYYKKETKESFYGEIMPSGFTMTYPKSYIKILSHCFRLSTNTNNLIQRALTLNDKLTIKRLDCYTKGLGYDLLDFELNGQSAEEIAYKNKNTQAINYIKNL